LGEIDKETYNLIIEHLSDQLRKYKSSLGFKDIDEKFLKAYEKWMLDEGNSVTTVGIYLRCLRTMFNKAINEGILSNDYYLFRKHKYVILASRNIKKALTLGEVKRIFEYETTPYTAQDFAKDIWVFSYLSNGMNIKDIALLKKKDIDGEYLRFIRAKTPRSTRSDLTPISVYLSVYAKDIINKWGDLTPGDRDDFLFPILKPLHT
jgi:integrase/recombinase XerD